MRNRNVIFLIEIISIEKVINYKVVSLFELCNFAFVRFSIRGRLKKKIKVYNGTHILEMALNLGTSTNQFLEPASRVRNRSDLALLYP